MNITIRPFTPADCPGIAQVQVNSYRTAYASFFPPTFFAHMTEDEQAQEWLDWPATHPQDALLVAVSPEGEILGYVLTRVEPDIYPGYDTEILALHVRQAQQRQGIGGALLHTAVTHLREQGCQAVMLWTLHGNPIRTWYERLGGQLLGEKRFDVDGWEVVEVAYGWSGWPDWTTLN